MNLKRVRVLKEGIAKNGPVVYWMQRDQRVHDNWALLYSQHLAIEKNVPLIVVFNLVPNFLEAAIRQYGFMLRGLQELEEELNKFSMSFHLTFGNPVKEIPKFVKNISASFLVTDFNPLRNVLKWKGAVISKIAIPFHEVDAHNIVPCWVVSSKQEFAARTIRPKIHHLLPEFLDGFPKVQKMRGINVSSPKIDWQSLRDNLKINFDVLEVARLKAGEAAAHKVLKEFVAKKLKHYCSKKNDPTENFTSNLSPYLHFGQIAAQRVALTISQLSGNDNSRNSFLEELIVRRELSDNFCYHNKSYDSFDGFPDWAKQSLDKHRNDRREFVYSIKKFEEAQTHDNLWNAAQLEMTTTGKMHGYMRMYWTKKILEWTKSPEDALRIAIYLNDKYELDGRDPNGYVGIAWSIGGVHDRPWFERPILGKIRYMNYNGCAKKFDVNKYIEKFFSKNPDTSN